MIISNDKAQPSPAPTTKVGPKFTLSLRIDYGDQTRTTVIPLDQDALLKLILEANTRELTLADFVANLISTYARHELSAIDDAWPQESDEASPPLQ
jgi:hypothetical protein